MAEVESLAKRIRAEFEAQAQRHKAAAEASAREKEEREKRQAQFEALCEDLRAIWRPRLDVFAQQFGDQIQVTPSITPTLREARISFDTDLATVTLTLTVSANSDITSLILDYDLQILPVFFEFERHARLEMPMGQIDRDALADWLDNRLLDCVKTYLSLQDNAYYVKRALVEDPMTGAQFRRSEAGAKLAQAGHVLYFESDESMEQYKKKLGITD